MVTGTCYVAAPAIWPFGISATGEGTVFYYICATEGTFGAGIVAKARMDDQGLLRWTGDADPTPGAGTIIQEII